MHTLLAWLVWFFHTSFGKGALIGVGPAVGIDLHTFFGYKKASDLFTWDWRTALLRWAQGFLYGGLTGASLLPFLGF